MCREKEQWEARAKQQAAEQQAAVLDVSPLSRTISHPACHTASNTGNDANSVSSSCTLQSNRTMLCQTDSSAPVDTGEHTGGQPAQGLPSISAAKGDGEGEEAGSETAGASVQAAAAAAGGASTASAAAGTNVRARHANCEEAIPLAFSNVGLPTLKAQVYLTCPCELLKHHVLTRIGCLVEDHGFRNKNTLSCVDKWIATETRQQSFTHSTGILHAACEQVEKGTNRNRDRCEKEEGQFDGKQPQQCIQLFGQAFNRALQFLSCASPSIRQLQEFVW
jgi:hypothetical protein